MTATVLAIVLVLLLVSVVPLYASSRGPGCCPSDILAIVVATAAIAALL